MNRKEFEELKVNDWFHLGDAYDFQVIHTDESGHKVIEYNLRTERVDYNYWQFGQCESFKLGRYSESYNQQLQSTVQKMTITDAIKRGLKVGDKIPIEFLVIEIDSSSQPVCIEAKEENIIKWLSPIDKIAFAPQPEHLYKPAHNELCTILTKNGLGTKAIAVHYNGKISAISIDNEGNADCHFKAEQIEKFYPLPPA